MHSQVFISYSSSDKLVAEEICCLLEGKGIACWIAPRDITPGKNYGTEIVKAIESTHAMVVILSEYANKSTHVKNEVERAVSKGKSIFPIRIREVEPSKDLELFISTAHWVDAWIPPLKAKIGQLSEAIKELLTTKKNLLFQDEYKKNNQSLVNDISQHSIPSKQLESDLKISCTQNTKLLPQKDRFTPLLERQITTGFSTLTPVIDRESGKKCFIKKISKDRISQKQQDIYSHMRIDDSGVVFPITFWEEGDAYYELLPMIEGWTLLEIMNLNKGIFGEYLTLWSLALLDLVKTLQQNNPPLIHRDIKPSNVMVRKENLSSLVLIDCNAMVSYPVPDNIPILGTPGYAAPEIMKGSPTLASDLYSVGCTIYYLNQGKTPPTPTQIKHCEQTMKLVCAEYPVERVFSRLIALELKDRFPDVVTALEPEEYPYPSLLHMRFDDLILPDGSQIEQGGWFGDYTNCIPQVYNSSQI